MAEGVSGAAVVLCFMGQDCEQFSPPPPRCMVLVLIASNNGRMICRSRLRELQVRIEICTADWRADSASDV
jgi:hypothetical protein